MKLKISMCIGATALIAAAIPVSVPAQETDAAQPAYRVLYTFTGGADGALPGFLGGNALTLDRRGNLYGTADAGGDPSCAVGFFAPGCGVVFQVDRHGKETTLHTFTGPDGADPDTGMVRDWEGNLYGSTAFGGSLGFGAVFKIDRNGNETVLYSFTGGADGNSPQGGVIGDEEGNLYGATTEGGDVTGGVSSPCDSYGCGVVFKVDRWGNETVLYTFAGVDGKDPYGGLLRDERGNLYGTTIKGGTFGDGVVFKLDRWGNETVLYSFSGGADGANPFTGVIRDERGNLYGTTEDGGNFPGFAGSGVVFKLDRAGNETVLYTFTGGTDGGVPYGRLLRREGNLYGTTLFGGDLNGLPQNCAGFGCGVVFKLDRAGKETVLYSFTGYADGANPYNGLVGDEEGNLYGTTGYGGDLASTLPACAGIGCGVVFQLKLHGERWDDSAEESSNGVSEVGAAPPVTSKPAGRARMLLPDGTPGGPWYRIPDGGAGW